MAECCAFSRSGANSGSIGSCHNFAEDKDGEGSDRESFSCCLHPWEGCCMAAVCVGAGGKSDEPISCELLRETQTFPSGQQPCSDLLSVLLSFCSCSLWQSSTVRDLLPVFTSSLSRVLFPLSPLLFLQGLFPFNNTVADIKEVTPLKLNGIVTKQNEVIESRRDVGLLTWGYKCSPHPWIKGIVFLEKNLFSFKNLLVDWGSFLETALTCIFYFQWIPFGQEGFPISSLLGYSSCLTESFSSAL